MKYVLFTPVFFFLLQLSGSPAMASDSNDLSADCDKAIHVFWKARMEQDKDQSRQYYQEAIDLCPGYIRPYEMVGNLYRKENQTDTAITYFNKAAELGTTNYKLYYLLASLLFEKARLRIFNFPMNRPPVENRARRKLTREVRLRSRREGGGPAREDRPVRTGLSAPARVAIRREED